MPLLSPLPARLKEVRTRASISQRELGIRVGIDPGVASSRMNHYEKGRHTPDLDVLSRIAKEVGVPLAYFFCESENSARLVELIHKLSEADQLTLLHELEGKAD